MRFPTDLVEKVSSSSWDYNHPVNFCLFGAFKFTFGWGLATDIAEFGGYFCLSSCLCNDIKFRKSMLFFWKNIIETLLQSIEDKIVLLTYSRWRGWDFKGMISGNVIDYGTKTEGSEVRGRIKNIVDI